jgi:Skp family chaperone for outer membrane proteins
VLRNHFLLAATIFFSLSPTCHGQTQNTVVATINFLHAVFDSNEGKKELPAIGTKSQETQQRIQQTVQAILVKMAPVVAKFAKDNGLGVVTDTSKQLPEPVLWSKQPGGDILRKQVDITKLIIDDYNGSSVHLPPVNGDQSVELINLERATFNTDEGKRELAAIGDKATPEQKQEISQRILVKMTPLIAKFAGDSGADIVIDISQRWPKCSVVWFDDGLDITERVVSAYNGR